MSGETEERPSGWSVDTLRAHVSELMAANDRRYEERFTAQEGAVNAALRAAQQAVDKAELATEKRFEGVNEFRAQLADQARTLMPRSETELQLANLATRIAALERSAAQGGGRSEGLSAATGFVFAAIGAFVGLAGLIFAFTR